MFAWLPILGPLIEGVTSIWRGYQTIENKKLENDLEYVKLQHQLAMEAKNDVATRLSRDLICVTTSVWFALVGWDTIVAESVLKNWMWHTANFPAGNQAVIYMPMAVLTYLFGMAWLKLRK